MVGVVVAVIARDLGHRGAVGDHEDALVAGALHERHHALDEPRAELDLALAAELDVEVAVGRLDVQVLGDALELAEVPLLEALNALVGDAGHEKLARVAAALGRGGIDVVEGWGVRREPGPGGAALLDAELGQGRVAPALLAAQDVEEGLPVADHVESGHELLAFWGTTAKTTVGTTVGKAAKTAAKTAAKAAAKKGPCKLARSLQGLGFGVG